jgi:hypothetical protein
MHCDAHVAISSISFKLFELAQAQLIGHLSYGVIVSITTATEWLMTWKDASRTKERKKKGEYLLQKHYWAAAIHPILCRPNWWNTFVRSVSCRSLSDNRFSFLFRVPGPRVVWKINGSRIFLYFSFYCTGTWNEFPANRIYVYNKVIELFDFVGSRCMSTMQLLTTTKNVTLDLFGHSKWVILIVI